MKRENKDGSSMLTTKRTTIQKNESSVIIKKQSSDGHLNISLNLTNSLTFSLDYSTSLKILLFLSCWIPHKETHMQQLISLNPKPKRRMQKHLL